jgi:uncharacterized OB-fold protein
MTELQIQRCERCGTNAFPDRLWCPGCGAAELRHAPAGPGNVEQETGLRRPPSTAPAHEPVRLGTVRLDSGPLVIARLSRDARAGTQVRLELTPSGAIWARATPD